MKKTNTITLCFLELVLICLLNVTQGEEDKQLNFVVIMSSFCSVFSVLLCLLNVTQGEEDKQHNLVVI